MTAATQTTASRTARFRKLSVTGLATAGAAALALTLAPSPAQAAPATESASKATVATAEVAPTKKDSPKKAKKAKKVYADNLDGWIKEALDIMKSEGIPGTYEGLHRNIMRESSGNPNAQNNWDVNAQNGTPSKGLLQVIQPTFDAYHVDGTPHDLTDPVANITAAANYAADRYGSIDNVDSAY
ncbi:transglycosylase SLT domain-containing protein [Streptomyces sp. PKU-EA00015]|uniref:transglycosylase SLT domain-containing protein n=1 Tax=Streptomyces sp. PKU-EA00015 TaxID=2748326 RepID=UPI0015A4BD5E|nr:transglycosylase SLT domain-containing protein [Streptomyces sp. PKU-EA00015]NWF25319.1 transglycosylase SLT domain-containing protein [Streptomyces sp. PKU-EA00015]